MSTIVPHSLSSPARIGVLASGGGSNLQALIDYFADDGRADGTIVWVGSNVADAGALQRAREAGIACTVVAAHQDGDAMMRALADAEVELLVLAGYLKLVPAAVVGSYRGRVLNVHPALLPAFGGHGMYGQRVHAAVIAHGARVSGVTVHFVDEVYDRGAIIAQWPVLVHAADTPATLAARVLRAEHALLPRAVAALARGDVALDDDGRVTGEVRLPDLGLPRGETSG